MPSSLSSVHELILGERAVEVVKEVIVPQVD